MKKIVVQQLIYNCNSLTLFRSLRKKSIFIAFERVLTSVLCKNKAQKINAWAHFLSILAQKSVQLDWEHVLFDLIKRNDNAFSRACENMAPKKIGNIEQLEQLAVADLKKLEQIATVDFLHLDKSFVHLKKNAQKKVDWASALFELSALWQNGSGIFTDCYAFVWKNKKLRPVKNFSAVPLNCLYGYDVQRKTVFENTASFALGKKANNMLLYGDRGTGKSATVKSIAAFFAQSNSDTNSHLSPLLHSDSILNSTNRIRIVEVRQEQLHEFTHIVETLQKRNFRFIVFIDDLSFNHADERYMGLKALLEGGLESNLQNVVVYATSNRRHLVKEKAADRIGLGSLDSEAEVRAEDAVQEHLSLADRFGITVIFSSPVKDEYLSLVYNILQERKIPFDKDVIQKNALRWELWYNGRSPRTAHQFVDWFVSGIKFPWDFGDLT